MLSLSALLYSARRQRKLNYVCFVAAAAAATAVAAGVAGVDDAKALATQAAGSAGRRRCKRETRRSSPPGPKAEKERERESESARVAKQTQRKRVKGGRVAQRVPVSQLRVDLVFAHTVALRQQQKQLSLLAVACGRHRRPGLPTTLTVTERESERERVCKSAQWACKAV